MAHALVPTARGRGFWSAFFGSRSPQLDPISEGTRTKIKILGTGYAVRGSWSSSCGSRRADLGRLARDRGGVAAARRLTVRLGSNADGGRLRV